MDQEGNDKEINSQNNVIDSKQTKKRKKKKHKKKNSQSLEEKKEELNNNNNMDTTKITTQKDEPKLESSEVIETKEEINQNIESKDVIKEDNNNINTEEVLNNNNAQETQEENKEIETTKITKKHKGKKRKGKNKGKKEEIKEEIVEDNKEENIIEENNTKNEEKLPELNNIILNNETIVNNNNIDEKINETKDNNNELDKEKYPEKDINPMNLIYIDEEDGEIDYLKAEQAYELSVFLDSHKFIRNIKNFDQKFINLIKRRIIRYERNLYELSLTNKFFILYELQISKNPGLSLSEILILDVIKSILISYTDSHLIIFIPDKEFLNINNKDNGDSSLIEKYSKEKLTNILIYLNLDTEKEKRLHVISSKLLSGVKNFENQKIKFKSLLNKKKLLKLFNYTSDTENDAIMDYPCTLSLASNPSLYTEYIPEISSEYKCLIINSIFYMNRYQLMFSASEYFSFTKPSIIALKIFPQLTGINGQESNYNIKENNIILSSDDDSTIEKKLKEIAYKDEQRNKDLDIGCQYLYFLEENEDIYNNLVNNYEEGKGNDNDINERCLELIKEKFQIFKENNINEIDVNKFFVEIK